MQRIARQFAWITVLALTTVVSVPPAMAGTRGGHNQEDRNHDRNHDRNRDRDRGRGHDNQLRDRRHNDGNAVKNNDRNRQSDDHGKNRQHDGGGDDRLRG